jgi:hypothetical protein
VDNSKIVKGLLHKLAAEHKMLTWTMKCLFADGKGHSFHQINIRCAKQKKEKVIVFQMETGNICHYACKGVNTAEADTVIDVLLDIINEQNLVIH